MNSIQNSEEIKAPIDSFENKTSKKVSTIAYPVDVTKSKVTISDQSNAQEKIKKFLEREEKNLSKEFPFLLNLFQNGDIAKNKAGIRISETPQSFPLMEKNPATQLSGLFFFYSLYDHAMRVPHWHGNAVEMGVVLNGHMKITIWDGPGNRSEFTVEKGGAWMIPQAAVHCLENIGEEQLDFVVVYNTGYADDRDFATAWAALPDTILEKPLGLSPNDITNLKKSTKNRLSLWDMDAIPTLKNASVLALINL